MSLNSPVARNSAMAVAYPSVILQNAGKSEAYFLGQAEDPLLESRKSCIWTMHSRSGKRGETVRERIPSF